MVSDWPGSSIEFAVQGTKSVSLNLGLYPNFRFSCSKEVGVRYFLNVWIGGTLNRKVEIKNAKSSDVYLIADDLDPVKSHTIRVIKVTEAYCGSSSVTTCGPWSIS
jgi:hypothetical protein